MTKRFTSLAAVIAASALVLTGCAAADTTEDEPTRLTFRLWDETVAKSYEKSFAAFEKENPGIKVDVNVVPWNDYFTKLRTDVAGKSMDDLFWVNNSYFGAYADSGNLVDIGATLGEGAKKDWEPSVVDQFTRNEKLWGVPQLYDAGIAVYYNKTLLEAAGIDPKELDDLEWSPDAEQDTFLPVAKKLTKDAAGVSADAAGFNPKSLAQYGTNISYDLQAILLPYIGSNGGVFQDGDDFAFSDGKTVEAVEYLVNAINKAHVAPAAADTNGTDFSRDAFLQGKLALFQSGLYNLKNISDDADFDWGVASIPAGPEGRVSVTNGVVVAGNAASKQQPEVKKLLSWLGSKKGNAFLGASGAAVPGVKSAQSTYFDFWEKKDVDVAPFFDVIKDADTIPAPTGPNFGTGFAEYDPIFQEIFKGTIAPKDGLQKAQAAANAALSG